MNTVEKMAREAEEAASAKRQTSEASALARKWLKQCDGVEVGVALTAAMFLSGFLTEMAAKGAGCSVEDMARRIASRTVMVARMEAEE